jgi:hypothetical protein
LVLGRQVQQFTDHVEEASIWAILTSELSFHPVEVTQRQKQITRHVRTFTVSFF